MLFLILKRNRQLLHISPSSPSLSTFDLRISPSSPSLSTFDLRLMGELSFPGQHEGVLRSISETPPTHYVLKLQLFSQLANKKLDSYSSNEFEAGGCKWKLVLHPNGNKNKGISDHISLYLVIADSNSRGPAWEIRANFRLYLLDQNKDSYLTLQENGRRFHSMKIAWGFDKFIHLEAFKDAANGYLVDDTTVFGAEVYVCQENIAGKGECLSMIKDAIAYKHTWRFDFSKLDEECVDSTPFNAADRKWKVQFYRNGKGSGIGGYVSIYLALAEPESLPPGLKLYAEFTIRILDQLNRQHYFGTSNYWFSASNSTSGWPRFVSHGYLHQPTTGLLVKNMCLVEAEVKVHGVANAI